MENPFKIKVTISTITTVQPENYPSHFSKQDMIDWESDPEIVIDMFEMDMDGGEGWEMEVEEVDEEDEL